MMSVFSWQMMKLFNSTRRAKAGKDGASGEAAPANADVRLTIKSPQVFFIYDFDLSFVHTNSHSQWQQ